MAKLKRKDTFWKVFSVLAFIISTSAIIILLSSKTGTKLPEIGIDISNLPELSTIGYEKINVEANVIGNQGFITVTSTCYQLTATTEAFIADSIQKGMSKMITERPNIHDIVKDVFENLDIDVIMVKIYDQQNQTYLGKLIIRQGAKIVSLDSRPSDGIALAVRTDAPIYMKEDLLKANGRNICE